jgi:antirestriction protein ArdC
MPNSRMADRQISNRLRRPCGIILDAALWVLCRYRHNTHWSGHGDRLARDLKNRFGDEAYAMEELIAELGASFLCAENAIANEPRPDHACYIADWLKVLKNDKRAVFAAARKASEATGFLIALQSIGEREALSHVAGEQT